MMKKKEVLISGLFTGISAVFAKIGMTNAPADFTFLFAFLSSPMLLISVAFGVTGFAYLQISLHKSDLSFVGPVAASLAIITPVILAVIFLNEYVPPLRWVGVGLLILGMVGWGKG